MELRRFHCFIVAAEDFHVARVAEQLRIEPSPLSLAIKKLQNLPGTIHYGGVVSLFGRSTEKPAPDTSAPV